MRAISFILLAGLLFATGCTFRSKKVQENKYNIMPAPVSMVPFPGVFSFKTGSSIIVSPLNGETAKAADFLADLFHKSTGVAMPVENGDKAIKHAVFMKIDTTIDVGKEGYKLEVTSKRIVLLAPTAEGLFHGVQTIRQLLPPQVESVTASNSIEQFTVPQCMITDEPRFSYRGMHLDVCRHIFPVEEIKRYIDVLALNKFNTFHWHLTDDQGWRIEIKKYPKLTEVGSMRKETLIGHGATPPFTFDGKPYGGFFTQEEVKEIVKYASDRFITIIPEIEMPGHALAALSAYPEFACTKGPFEAATQWGVFDDVFCAGKDTTFAFLEEVLDEVMELFPSSYIHVGGDECPKVRWEKCPNCLKRMKDENLKNAGELQSYFVKRIESYLNSHGRNIIGWDEILEGGIAPEATVMSWRGTEGGIFAAKLGHDVIMTPGTYLYLDHYQSKEPGQPLAIGGYLPLELVYSYDPMPKELTADEQKYILGLQGNVWTEYILNSEHLEYMAFPRAFAIAETGWTPVRRKDFEDFLTRFEAQRERYDILGINYFKGEYRNTEGRTE
jgi:hexosaminidase